MRLAEEILRDLNAVAAKIPKLRPPYYDEDFLRGHGNVPVQFMSTAVWVVEQIEDVTGMVNLSPDDGHETLQFLDAFRAVQDRLEGITAEVRQTMKNRKAHLAWQCLQVYAITRGLARDRMRPELAVYVEALRRDLGPRGRPRLKKKEEA